MIACERIFLTLCAMGGGGNRKRTSLKTKQKRPLRVFFVAIEPISRVLSCAIIYLRLTSPSSFGFRRATRGYVSGRRSPCGVASDRVYSKERLPAPWVSSYLAFPSLPSCPGGLFLLHFPGSRLRLTLSVILPCEARTFLTVTPFGTIPRDRPTRSLVNYIAIRGKCQV